MKDRLFVEGLEIQLDPRKPGAYTINGIDISNVTVQRSNYSSRLKIPNTPQNLKRLGNPEAVAASGRSCYKLLPCSYEIQGFQIVPFGVLRIDDITDDIEATVFSGEASLFKDLQTLYLSNISGLAGGNHFWNEDEVEEYTASAGGENLPVYALINYKKNPVAGNYWNWEFMFPSWYVYDLIQMLLQDQGYNIDLNNLDWADDFFYNLIVPFTNKEFKNGKPYIEEHTFKASSNADTTVDFDYVNSTGYELIDLTQAVAVQVDSESNPNYSSPNFTEPNASKVTLHGAFRVSSFSHSLVDNPPVDPPTATHYIAFIRNGSIVHQEQIGFDGSLTLATYQIETEITLAQSDTVQLAFVSAIESLTSGDEVTVDAVLTDCLFYTQNVQQEIFPGGWIEAAFQLPKLKQSEFLKTIGTITASYIVADPINKRWAFKRFKDIVKAKGSALNWDSKLVRKPNQANWYISKKTKPSGFFQESTFEWAEDETVSSGLGEGVFTLDNEALDKAGEVSGNVFAASEQRAATVNAGKKRVCAYLDKYDDDDKAVELEPRLLILNPLDAGFNITLTDSGGSPGLTTTPYIANFALETVGATNGGLAWGNDVENRFWKELRESLSNFVEVEVYLHLTASDIASIIEQYQKTTEPIVPIFLQGFFWVVKQIKQFRAKEFTVAVLTKIS